MLRPLEPKDITLSVCCFLDKGKLNLRIIQVTKNSTNLLPHPLHVALFSPVKNFVDYYHASLARFHKLPIESHGFEELFTSLREHYRHELFQDSRNPFITNRYIEYHDFVLKLPSDETLLLKALSVLDNALYELQYHSSAHHHRIHVYYCDHLQGRLSNDDILKLATPSEHSSYEAPKKTLSCYVAEWMIHKIDKKADELQTYQTVKKILTDLLQTNPTSLTQSITHLLYPNPDLDAFIKESCDNDPLMVEALNPNIGHIRATAKIIDVIKPLIRHPHTRHAVNEWLINLENCKQKVWQHIVKTLIGNPASANGHYESHYAEIQLLCSSRITRNENGLMELHFHETEIYRNRYAPHKPGHDVFQIELEHACRTLGLHFVTGQDLRISAVFDKSTSNYLMDLGFHYNKEYFQRLIKLSHHVFWHTQIGLDLPRHIKAKIQAISHNLHHDEADLMAHRPSSKGS